eukprot:TRINITY_DN5950_c0_g1_i1.p1 TRINITY_DN5950_c0_g1~~TRINITY_DN5950_c0_g1_i1.p1  ORF type:complete len:269 (+),score=96.33 TRINITY_DN5950_c0_g1_i1:1-807(+)
MNSDVKQHIYLMQNEREKFEWLAMRLQRFINTGSVVIFVGQKQRVDELVDRIKSIGQHSVEGIHGKKHQIDRNNILLRFRKGAFKILVATDLAARGLDVDSIKTVVCYDDSRNQESHVHRIGRTGRAGAQDGEAHVLIRFDQSKYAADIIHSLERSKQEVPSALVKVAMGNRRFAEQRGGGRGRGRGRGRGGGGRGGGRGRGGRGMDDWKRGGGGGGGGNANDVPLGKREDDGGQGSSRMGAGQAFVRGGDLDSALLGGWDPERKFEG